MQVPPNYGTDYANRFAALFETVAKAQKAAVVPFFLKGVADGLTPPACSSLTASTPRPRPTCSCWPMWPELKKLLR